MNNKNTLVISMLITATVIGFVETDVVQINKSQLYADQEKTAFILKKGDEIVEIQPGNKIIINEQVMTYRSVDKVNKLILVAGQNVERTIRFDEILTINIPAGTKAKEYGIRALIHGALAGFGLVAILLYPYDDPNSLYYLGSIGSLCAGISGGTLGITGAAYGYTKKTGGETYQLGPSEWEIANE